MSFNKNTINRNHVSRFKMYNISNQNIPNRNFPSFSRSNHVYNAIFFLFVEFDKLSLLLEIVQGPNNDDDDNGDYDSDTFNPFNGWMGCIVFNPKGLV